jgi:hypothetical protein
VLHEERVTDLALERPRQVGLALQRGEPPLCTPYRRSALDAASITDGCDASDR